MTLIILDETLRDGEQQVGVNFTNSDKFRIAKKMSEIGVDHIVMMPAVSRYDENLSKKMLNSKAGNKIYALTMLDEKFVDHSIKLGFKNIILLASLSDRLLRIKNLTKSQNLRKAISVCKYGKSKGLNILCYGEDATRANRKYVVKFIKGIQRYIDGFVLCDTVGVLTPKKTERFVDYIKNNINCKIGAHFHNDRGLANKNTIAAINHGTEIISGTAGGIGERAGNADWCRILNDLRKEKINTNIYYSELSSLIQFVYKVGGSKPAKPYSSRAFWHESGIHVNALLRDELSYNSFLPKKYGKKNRFFYGKMAGVSNYRYLLGKKYSEEHLLKIRNKIKELAYKNKKSYNSTEVKKLIRNLKI